MIGNVGGGSSGTQDLEGCYFLEGVGGRERVLAWGCPRCRGRGGDVSRGGGTVRTILEGK